MSFFNTTSTTTNTANASGQAEKDIEVADPPPESISSISFSSQADYLAIGSWDNSVSPGLCTQFVCSIYLRFEFMKLEHKGRHRGRRCTHTMAQFLMFAGTRRAK